MRKAPELGEHGLGRDREWNRRSPVRVGIGVGGAGPALLMQARSGELPGEWAWQSQPPTPATRQRLVPLETSVLSESLRGRDRGPGGPGGPGSGLAGHSGVGIRSHTKNSRKKTDALPSRSSLSLEDRQRFGLDGHALGSARLCSEGKSLLRSGAASFTEAQLRRENLLPVVASQPFLQGWKQRS